MWTAFNTTKSFFAQEDLVLYSQDLSLASKVSFRKVELLCFFVSQTATLLQEDMTVNASDKTDG